jgi:26S proteasome regulatory subunit N10
VGAVIWLLGFKSLAFVFVFLHFLQSNANKGIQQLALKHRQNKSQKQRIIVFTCSPIPEDGKTLDKLAKKMKKNGVAIDFVAFGELDDENTKKLTSFNENVKSGDGSHIAIIHPGPGLLSDQLVTSPILNGDGSSGGAGAGGEGGGGGEAFEFGIDPSVDPELALALRMSMEEEKARVEKANKEKAEQEAKEKAAALPEIKEEDEASQPLLNQDGEPSVVKEEKKDDDADKMDTA